MYRDETKNLKEFDDFVKSSEVPIHVFNLFSIGGTNTDVTIQIVDSINPPSGSIRFNSFFIVTNETTGRASFYIVNSTSFYMTYFMIYSGEDAPVYTTTKATVTRNLMAGQSCFVMCMASLL